MAGSRKLEIAPVSMAIVVIGTEVVRMDWRIIETEQDLLEGQVFLAACEPRFASALQLIGVLPLRRKPAGFATLLDAVMSQQVSVASANAIWKRLEAAQLTDPETIAAATEEALRACGLSRQKIAYAYGLANSGLDYDALRELADEDVIAKLVALPGIGRWTAEVYALSALGRANVFAAGDLALQEAARALFEMEKRPSERELRKLAESWSPWRAVAARLLWAYYRVTKEREGTR